MGLISDKITEGGREKAIRRIIFLEGMANFAVLSVKAVVGFTTGSMAIIGDALHSLTDVANNIV
ncbi:MAG: cation transporter, partial [Kangiellaceae bacterium]|nr:cation transporter [Kangiellaceae bacterium]